MISIVIAMRSLWACKILNGDKSIDVRKDLALYNALKKAEERGEEVEFLMYVTKAEPSLLLWTSKTKEKCRKAILQVDEAQADRELDEFMNYEFCVVKHPQYFGGKVYFEPTYLNGKVVAKFTLREVERIEGVYDALYQEFEISDIHRLSIESCVDEDDLIDYLSNGKYNNNSNDMYGYALHISNLEIFDKPKTLADYGLKRAPQSWCYAKDVSKERRKNK